MRRVFKESFLLRVVMCFTVEWRSHALIIFEHWLRLKLKHLFFSKIDAEEILKNNQKASDMLLPKKSNAIFLASNYFAD